MDGYLLATFGYVNEPVGLAGQRNLAFYRVSPGHEAREPGGPGAAGRRHPGVEPRAPGGARPSPPDAPWRARFGADAASRCVLLLSVFPFSFYFSAVYSESLFLLLAVAALFLGEQGRWAGASVCALLCGATRAPGLALVLALGLLYLERIRYDVRKIRPDVLGLG